jgi:hypothetical protein
MACVSGDIGWLMTGNVLYRLGSRVGIQKRTGKGGHMGWSGVRGKIVDRVSNGTSAGSICIGDGGHITGIGVERAGAGAGTGATGGGADASIDAGAIGGGAGASVGTGAAGGETDGG